MAFTVANGSGVAIIPCGNSSGATPYTRGGVLLFPQRTSRKFHVACAKKPLDEEISAFSKVLDGDVSVLENESFDDDDAFLKFVEEIDLKLQQPDFWDGPQWNWFGTLIKFSWILGFGVAACLAIYGCFTFHEPPKSVREAAEKLYSVQSGVKSSSKSNVESDVEPNAGVESSKVFEEPAYDSDVFDSNPTEVAPSLE